MRPKQKFPCIGDRIDMLCVVAIIPPRQKFLTRRLWCFCACGSEALVSHHTWKKAITSDVGHCGCKRRLPTHLPSCKSPEYRTWLAIKSRCKNSSDRNYRRYGGRGITVDPAIDKSFAAFFAELGPKPTDRHSVDRIDNNKGYAPGNMRWAYRSQQQLNRSNNRLLSAHGKTQSIVEWSRELNLAQRTITGRLLRGKSIEDALQPSRLKKRIYTFDGKKQDLAKWCRELGLHYATVLHRINRGLTFLQSIEAVQANAEKRQTHSCVGRTGERPSGVSVGPENGSA